MEATRKASRRAPPPPIWIPPATPSPRSFGSRRSTTPRPASSTAHATPTPSSSRWSPESYGLAKLFASPAPASSMIKPEQKSRAFAGYTSGYTKSPTKRTHAKVTVYEDVQTLKMVKGRQLVEQEVDTPVPAASARTPRLQSGGRRSPKPPRSPTYSSGRMDPEWKLVRRKKSSARTQFAGGYKESLE